jgi:hypothetical protein
MQVTRPIGIYAMYGLTIFEKMDSFPVLPACANGMLHTKWGGGLTSPHICSYYYFDM